MSLSWPHPTPYPDYYYSDLTNFTFDSTHVSHHIPWTHRVALTLYAAIFLLGVPGNAVVIWLSSMAQHRAVPAVWYLHLAIADLLCCMALPFLAIPVAGDHRWPLGDTGCKLFPALAIINMYSSVLLLAAISADRCLIVTKPTWCHKHRTPRRAHWVSFIIWLSSTILTIPTFIHRRVRHDPFADTELCVVDYGTTGVAKTFTAVTRFTVGFLLPFAAITVCHTVLLTQLHRRGVRRTRRAAGTVMAIVVTFFVCWLPFHVIGLILLANRSNTELYRGAAMLDP
ncbi:C5a anaphylatoxin chemotactic receptor 1-like, partial [Coturnix japonica]|uniref:C5a anaphylatoxin chemotactic receptor 1-like n=1 Tax=Coturnix japonica TaxID=93934 RepID=UPI000777EC90